MSIDNHFDAVMTDREIVITRDVDFPRALVWKAFTDAEHIKHWWGPNGFTNTIHEMNVKVGGVWRFIMHGPDGTDYPNHIAYTKLVEPERLEYDHTSDGRKNEDFFHAIATFEALDGGTRTRVTLRLQCTTAEQRAKKEEFGVIEGGRQTMGRLAAYLAKM
jgi:uncharacterized protein YndB with AHSA1/START domain